MLTRAGSKRGGGEAMGAIAPPLGDFFPFFILFLNVKRDMGPSKKWTKSEFFFNPGLKFWGR